MIVAILMIIFSYISNNKNVNLGSQSSLKNSNAAQDNNYLNPNNNTVNSNAFVEPKDSVKFGETEINQDNSKNLLEHGLNRFAFDMSRELCNQEQISLEEILDSQDSKRKPNTAELVNLLKKTANSKCSSFRRNNAQQLFFKFKLDENNYKQFLNDFSLVLGDYQGTIPLKLMRASIRALEHAKPEEVKPLRDAIIFSLNTTINDSSAFIDVGVSVAILKELSEKALISGPRLDEINALQDEFKKTMQEQIKRNVQSRKNDDYPVNKMADYLNYEDAKTELRLIREEYETVEQFRNRLIGFMERSFQ